MAEPNGEDEDDVIGRVIDQEDAVRIDGWRQVQATITDLGLADVLLVQWQDDDDELAVWVGRWDADSGPKYRAKAVAIDDDVRFSPTTITSGEESLETALDEVIRWMRRHPPGVDMPTFSMRIEGGIFKPLIELIHRLGGGDTLVEVRPDSVVFESGSAINNVDFRIPASDMEHFSVEQSGEFTIETSGLWDPLKPVKFGDMVPVALDASDERPKLQVAAQSTFVSISTGYFRRNFPVPDPFEARFTADGQDFKRKISAIKSFETDQSVFGVRDGVAFIHVRDDSSRKALLKKDYDDLFARVGDQFDEENPTKEAMVDVILESTGEAATGRFETTSLEGEGAVLVDPERLQDVRRAQPRPSSTPVTFTLRHDRPLLVEYTVGETDTDVLITLKSGAVPFDFVLPPREVTVPEDAPPGEAKPKSVTISVKDLRGDLFSIAIEPDVATPIRNELRNLVRMEFDEDDLEEIARPGASAPVIGTALVKTPNEVLEIDLGEGRDILGLTEDDEPDVEEVTPADVDEVVTNLNTAIDRAEVQLEAADDIGIADSPLANTVRDLLSDARERHGNLSERPPDLPSEKPSVRDRLSRARNVLAELSERTADLNDAIEDAQPEEAEEEPEEEPEQESEFTREQLEAIIDAATVGVDVSAIQFDEAIRRVELEPDFDNPVIDEGASSATVNVDPLDPDLRNVIDLALEQWQGMVEEIPSDVATQINRLRSEVNESFDLTLPTVDADEEDVVDEDTIADVLEEGTAGTTADVSIKLLADSIRITLTPADNTDVQFTRRPSEVQGQASNPWGAIREALEEWEDSVNLASVDAQTLNSRRSTLESQHDVSLPTVEGPMQTAQQVSEPTASADEPTEIEIPAAPAQQPQPEGPDLDLTAPLTESLVQEAFPRLPQSMGSLIAPAFDTLEDLVSAPVSEVLGVRGVGDAMVEDMTDHRPVDPDRSILQQRDRPLGVEERQVATPDDGLPEGEAWIVDQIENRNRIISNSFLTAGVVEIVFPERMRDEVMAVVTANDIAPFGPEAFVQEPSFKDQLPGIAADLLAVQFLIEDPGLGDLRSTGYNVRSIMQSLANKPVVALVAPRVRANVTFN